MFQNKLKYKTKKFDLKIFYKSGLIDAKKIIVDKDKFSEMCKKGCGVYDSCWACPPHSPSFLDIKNGFGKVFVFITYIHTDKIKIGRSYLVLSNIYNILAPKMYKLGMILEKHLDGLLLKSGPCRVCRKCSFIEHKPCRFPDKKRYALESTGVNVDRLAMLLNHKLLWCDGKNLPEYTSLVCGVLTNKEVLQEKAYEEFKGLFLSRM